MRPLLALLDADRRRLAGQQVVRRPGVIGVVVRHRANDAQAIDALGKLLEVLANESARHIGADRRELAANLAGSVRLHVKRVLMRRPAPHEQQDARLCAAETRHRGNRL
jgi:hypothetical protein